MSKVDDLDKDIEALESKIKEKRELIQKEEVEKGQKLLKTAEINRDEFVKKIIREIPRLDYYNKRLKYGFNSSPSPYLDPQGELRETDLSSASAKNIAFTQGTRGLLGYVSNEDFPSKKGSLGMVRTADGLAEHLGLPDIEPNFPAQYGRSNALLAIIDFLKEDIEALESRVKKLEEKK